MHTYGDRVFDYSRHCYLMGVLNVTPDSFSDGGKYLEVSKAVERGVEMVEEGADILDIGGESTRPGSDRISSDIELSRIMPVIEGILKHTDAVISVDTYKSSVAHAALSAGALIVNDISAMEFDPDMAETVRSFNATVILMHMKGKPKTMQANPYYDNPVEEIKTFLSKKISLALNQGIHQIIADPGLGFGKKVRHNLEIIKSLRDFTRLDVPLLVGPSRKSFIGAVTGLPVNERIYGTAAVVTASILNGASLVRVHEVKEMRDVVKTAYAVNRGASYHDQKEKSIKS